MKFMLFVLAVLAFAGATVPGLAADASNGQRLAERWCASCHLVSPNQRQASADVAPFASIAAKTPQFNAHALAFFLLAPHPKMPDMSLSRGEAEDLAAYIAQAGR
jgi:mono/diheme cytochrome c family protein